MNPVLLIEFFDTDASSYNHRLNLPLKSRNSFRLSDSNILEIDHSDGTTRFVPLANVKQYYEALPDPTQT